MGHKLILAALLLPLAACGSGTGSNPVNGNSGSPDDTILPGTTDVSANKAITRYEADDGDGSGYTQSFSYDEDNDEFTVDNLAFDGDNVYTRTNLVGTDVETPMGPFAVYENAATFSDPANGIPINQFDHRIIYGRSTNTTNNGDPATEFAIVRTGDYIDYGFGGFLYQRNQGVTMPSTGQAAYQGRYGALRDFKNAGGLEYATGDMQIAIDFEDFDAGDAVRGLVYNRQVFDAAGNDITSDMITALETKYGGTYSALPALTFTVTPNALDSNGEISGEVGSTIVTDTGALEVVEAGNYYAVMSGDDADEIVGVLVVTAEDPRYDGVTVRETGGYILYRP